MKGDAVLQFAFSNQSFELSDIDSDKEGYFRIEGNMLFVQWNDFVVGRIAVLNEEQVCTRSESGKKRCYALFKPNEDLRERGCMYLIQSVYEDHHNAYLKPAK